MFNNYTFEQKVLELSFSARLGAEKPDRENLGMEKKADLFLVTPTRKQPEVFFQPTPSG